MEERLRAFEMKKNEARGRLRRAVDEEAALAKPGKKERDEEAERQTQYQERLQKDGIDAERHLRLHQTQETLDEKDDKLKRKLANADVDVFGEDGKYRSFKRRRREIDFDPAAYARQKETLGDDFYDPAKSLSYGQSSADDPERVMAVVAAQKKADEKAAGFSRVRAPSEAKDVNFINERNRRFNDKIGRAYDQYTEEIRESLERGTAL